MRTYSFLINPQKKIPTSVQLLTGISNNQVIDQPSFEHFGQQIKDIIGDRIFVAHNVEFDLPFLNHELINNGFDGLDNKAIDTVELAQIAFPELPSYKLRDLAAHFELNHANPHHADSDAVATAELLLRIFDQLEALPQATLNTLSVLAKGLIRNTGEVFSEIANELRKVKRPLAAEQMQVRNLVLQKQIISNSQNPGKQAVFPQSDQEKRQLFKQHGLNFRRGQVSLINKIFDFLAQDCPNLMVEAPNGTGKTFSYLFSTSYRLYSGQKLVVATPTMVLQEQIMLHEIPRLLQVNELDLSAQVVKSASHYIDLDGFVQSLYQPNPSKQTLVLQMGILIWLTQTKTGDLDELQLTNFQAPLFSQICHPGDARVGTQFAECDFWNLARSRQEQADILVTNHAYLANHYFDSIWGQNPYLVIDEAHRFSDNVTNSRNDSLQFESFWGMLSHLRNVLFYADDSAQSKFALDSHISQLLTQLDPEIIKLIHLINDLQRSLANKKQSALSKQVLPAGKTVYSLTDQQLFPDLPAVLRLLTALQTKIEVVRALTSEIADWLYQNQDSLSTSWLSEFNELNDQLDRLDFYAEQAYLLSDLLNQDEKRQKQGFILTFSDETDPLTVNLSWLMLDPAEQLTQIYDRFAKRIFVSATLTSADDFTYSIRNLGLDKQAVVTYQGKQTFNLNQHMQIMAVSDSAVPVDPNSKQYPQFIGQFLNNYAGSAKHVLVLFSNLDTIKEVYGLINSSQLASDYEILAQGLTGSNDRLAKRFSVAQQAILLGANSFWEGIDFQGQGTDLVIVTKLPFEAPEASEVALRQSRLKDQGLNVFNEDSLPRMILLMRQACGRLIRGERDYGNFVILDQRVLSKDYGPKLLASLPVTSLSINLAQLEQRLSNPVWNKGKKHEL